MYGANTVNEFVPEQAHGEFYAFLEKHGHKKIVESFYGHEYPFPHKNYRNVNVWALLEDGKVIGMNESPHSGWSFPLVGKRGMESYYSKYFMAKKPSVIENLLNECIK